MKRQDNFEDLPEDYDYSEDNYITAAKFVGYGFVCFCIVIILFSLFN